MTAAAPENEKRGAALLLEHCAYLDRLGELTPPAHLRLEALLGDELARLLVFALAGDHGLRSRGVPG